MLKVVGASWLKTRISTYILIGCGFLVIGAIFVAEMERPQYDGTYCATVFWTEKTGFQVEYWKQRIDLDNIPKGVARTCYKDSTSENGWSQLEVETQRNYPDWVQAFGAGILEGSLTWRNIHHQWTNTIFTACDRDENSQNFCTWLRDILSANYQAIKEMASKRAQHDHYWHQIHLIYYQLEGLQAGWKKGAKRARSDLEIPAEDFLLMNAAADIQDLKIYYENYVMTQENDNNEVPLERNFLIPSASMMLKLFNTKDSGWNLLFGHSSAGSYSSMLRVQKRYKFRYHFYPDLKSSTVPGLDIMFTGYPGILASTDDFYIIKGRQVFSIVSGVGIKNENIKLWKNVNINNVIPLSARVMAANRLAQNRRTWARAMSRHPTTGNKQWILLDLRKIDAFNLHSTSNSSQINSEIVTHSRKGAIWVIEQLPGRLHAKEVTEEMTANDTAWFANGTPYFNEILEASGVSSENFSSDIDGSEIMNLDQVDKYLRAHAFRGDLLDDQSIPYGNIDMKLFSYSSRSGHSDFHAIAGPLFMHHSHHYNDELNNSESLIKDIQSNEIDLEIILDRRPVRNDIRAMAMRRLHGPFKWSQANEQISSVRHNGHPDEWNFKRVSPKWAWHD